MILVTRARDKETDIWEKLIDKTGEEMFKEYKLSDRKLCFQEFLVEKGYARILESPEIEEFYYGYVGAK